MAAQQKRVFSRAALIASMLVVISSFLAGPAYASSSCLSANPSSVSDVFECVATATVNQYNNANPFTNTQKAQCMNLKMVYSNVLMQNGLARDKVEEKLPTCAVFAKVLKDLNGEAPTWEACLGYDGSVNHMVTCLSNLTKNPNANGRQSQLLNNCAVAAMSYEAMLMSVNDNNKMTLPDNYKRPDCDTYLSRLQSVNSEVAEAPCAGFSASNINQHARKCLLSEPRLTKSNSTLSCQLLRQTYQVKVIQVYGKVPDGFRLMACSALEPIMDEITALRLQN
jgi:hypothetical protein